MLPELIVYVVPLKVLWGKNDPVSCPPRPPSRSHVSKWICSCSQWEDAQTSANTETEETVCDCSSTWQNTWQAHLWPSHISVSHLAPCEIKLGFVTETQEHEERIWGSQWQSPPKNPQKQIWYVRTQRLKVSVQLTHWSTNFQPWMNGQMQEKKAPSFPPKGGAASTLHQFPQCFALNWKYQRLWEPQSFSVRNMVIV